MELLRSEIIRQAIDFTSIGIFAIGFSKAIRKEVYEDQMGVCHSCGKWYPKLQTHHRVPRFFNGSNTKDNAVGLCPDCHLEADRQAFKGIIYPQVHK